MGVNPVQSGQGPESVRPNESQEQQQKLFELQWGIDVIGTYVAVTNKNGNIAHQLEGLKKGIKSGDSPESLVPSMNQLIDDINKGTPSNKALLPPFDLTSGGNEHKAMAQYAVTVEKYLNVAAENGKIDWNDQQPLFDKTRTLIDHIGNIPTSEAIGQLNDIIKGANKSLPSEFQLPALGKR